MFSWWKSNELAFVKYKESILEWHIKDNEYELKADTVAWTYKRYHKNSTTQILCFRVS